MLKSHLLTSLLLTTLLVTGCSVQRALNKPAPKELDFLARGAARDAVRSELGDFTVSADTPQCDVHVYVEGSGGGKYARAFLYSILDLGSAGIFEIFLNPIEAAIGNDKVRTKTCYNDRNLLLRASEFAKGGRERALKLAPADDPVIEAALEAGPVAVLIAPAASAPPSLAPTPPSAPTEQAAQPVADNTSPGAESAAVVVPEMPSASDAPPAPPEAPAVPAVDPAPAAAEPVEPPSMPEPVSAVTRGAAVMMV